MYNQFNCTVKYICGIKLVKQADLSIQSHDYTVDTDKGRKT